MSRHEHAYSMNRAFFILLVSLTRADRLSALQWLDRGGCNIEEFRRVKTTGIARRAEWSSGTLHV